MNKLIIDHIDKTPKVEQIVKSIKADIEKGVLKRGEKLLSITDFAKTHKIARDTVEKAYNRLKDSGHLESIAGKGNYVSGNGEQLLKVLLVFNKLSSYKKEIYYGFVNTLGSQAKVDLQIHHYDPAILKEIINSSKGAYHYYVIMPHLYHDTPKSEYENIFSAIDPNSLILLDRNLDINGMKYPSVFQDFKLDIYEALNQGKQLFKKYKGITVVFPELSHHPVEILEGIREFCKEQKKKFLKVGDLKEVKLKKGQVYITLTEAELAHLIKQIRVSGLILGLDVGVISFNETVLKELLEITVITTEFTEMGTKAAQMILEKNFKQVRNPFKLIIRKSL